MYFDEKTNTCYAYPQLVKSNAGQHPVRYSLDGTSCRDNGKGPYWPGRKGNCKCQTYPTGNNDCDGYGMGKRDTLQPVVDSKQKVY